MAEHSRRAHMSALVLPDWVLLLALLVFATGATKLIVALTLKWSKGFGPPKHYYSPRRSYDGSRFWGRKYK